jgi:hypothetical protein
MPNSLKNVSDLDLRQFIAVIRDLPRLQIFEKIDGLQVWFGLTDSGELFTSRPNDDKRFTSEGEYPFLASFNPYRCVHAALEKKKRDIQSVLSPDEVIQADVIFDRQPGSIAYGLDNKNFIMITHGVEETSDVKADQLNAVLVNQSVSAEASVVETSDGVKLDVKKTTLTFQFVAQQRLSNPIDTSKIEGKLTELENLLDSESTIDGLTNYDLIQTSLGSIPIEQREAAKFERDQLLSVIENQFKAEIHDELLKQLTSKFKSKLASAELTPDEDVGIAGVVFAHPSTPEMISIFDDDHLSTLSDFNSAIKRQLSSPIRTIDQDASLESQGGLTGQLMIRIHSLLGDASLAITRNAKDLISKNLGDSPSNTIAALAGNLRKTDDVEGLKRKIEAMIEETLSKLDSMLSDFKKLQTAADKTFSLRLRSGKTIGLSQSVIKRTLLSFAETRRNLLELKDKIEKVKVFEQLVAVLFGRHLKTLNSEVSESLAEAVIEDSLEELFERRNFTDRALYKKLANTWQLLNTYVATLVMTAIIYKFEDARGIRLLRDKKNYRLKKWSSEMSAFNFWGLAVWKPASPAVKPYLPPKIEREMARLIKKVPPRWVTFLHMDFSFANDVPVDWDDHYKTIKWLIKHSGDTNTDKVNSLIDGAFFFDKLTFDEKVKLLTKAYYHIMQFVPTSPLLTRFRAIQHKILTGQDPSLVQTMIMSPGQELISEEGEGGGDAGADSGVGAIGTTTAGLGGIGTLVKDIANFQSRLGHKYQIVRRHRNPEIKFKKFKRPKDSLI